MRASSNAHTGTHPASLSTHAYCVAVPRAAHLPGAALLAARQAVEHRVHAEVAHPGLHQEVRPEQQPGKPHEARRAGVARDLRKEQTHAAATQHPGVAADSGD